jgi:hypothetical protein
VGHNPAVPGRRQLIAALLLVAVSSAPELLWLGAHALDGHGHPGEGTALAEALVHGHDHPEGTPPHEHDLAPAPRLRQDSPRQLQSAASSSPLVLPPAARVALSPATLGGRVPGAASGCGPPRLQLLCSLLI